MPTRFILFIIIFSSAHVLAFSQDMAPDRTEVDEFIDNFFWYQKYLPQESVAELYVLRNTLLDLKENSPEDFEAFSKNISTRIQGFNNDVFEKLRQEVGDKNIKMTALEEEHGSNERVQTVSVQYALFIEVVGIEDYPENDICLDEIDRLYSELITRSRYKYPDHETGAYIVKAGDYFRRIAAKPSIYNDERQWQRIFLANKGKRELFLHPNNPHPDFIYPGVTIVIPPLGE